MVPQDLVPIKTKDSFGAPNGWLLPIWNATQSEYRPEQIYMTVVAPGAVKGPHLHCKRAGRFLCVHGDVVVVTRTWTTYTEHSSGDVAGYRIIEVPPGMPAALYNFGSVPAFVLNMPSPAWTPEDQDDWPVVEWGYPCHAD